MFRRLAFVDLETTGGNPSVDRITEIGIVRMADTRVIDEWSKLVNPERAIPTQIQRLTGISQVMVAQAPTFAELADEVRTRLEGWTFVAHSAQVDYGFLQFEFGRLGRPFLAEVLCTMQLSRRLNPEHVRHGLDALLVRHGFVAAARHRALGDARLLTQIYERLRQCRPALELERTMAALLRRPESPAPSPPDPGLAGATPASPQATQPPAAPRS